MVTALNVGNSILSRGFAEDIDITPMKLQKMIYFVYRDYYKKTGISLFNERFETWRYGPVVPSVYDKFKKCGSNAIRKYGRENDGKTILAVDEESAPVLKGILNDVWDRYKKYDGIYLSAITHKPNTAWSKAYEKRSPYLLDEDIRQEESIIE